MGLTRKALAALSLATLAALSAHAGLINISGSRLVTQQGGGGTLPAWAQTQTAGTWKKIAAGSAASGLDANQKGARLIDATSMTLNQDNIVGVWNGAGVIPDLAELCIARPGGHNDPGTTDVLCLGLRDDTPGWVNRSTQTVDSGGDDTSNGDADYSDDTPRESHTQRRPVGAGHSIWLAGMDNLASSLGVNSSAYFSFDRNTNVWTPHGKALTSGEFGASGLSFHGGVSLLDKSTGYIWLVVQKTDNFDVGIVVIDGNEGPTKGDILRKYHSYMPWGYQQGAIFHDLNPKLLVVGESFGALHYLDITTLPADGATVTWNDLDFSGTPSRFPNGGAAQGYWVYHKRSHAILCWDDDGANIIKLTVPADQVNGTYVWSSVALGGDTPTASPSTGTHGKFNLIENINEAEDEADEVDYLVIVNGVSEPTFAAKSPEDGF